MNVFRRAAALCAALVLLLSLAATAQTAGARIAGTIVDAQGGLPISRAQISLRRGTAAVATTQTGSDGRFGFESEPAGIYTIIVTADGYAVTASNDIIVAANTSDVSADLAVARQSATSARIIGRTATATAGRSLQTSTTISRAVDPTILSEQGFNRLAEGIGQLPGVSLRGANGNTGDDVYVDIRGLKPSETQTLLDGHPIGPIGVVPSTTSGGFNYLASPLAGLRNVQVTYGAGALGLYGTDSAGGSIDWQTLDPTTVGQTTFAQSYGTLRHLATTFTDTRTIGKVGTVFVHAVSGNDGLFTGDQQLQSGNLGTNLTSANIAANTYAVSGSSLMFTDLQKVRIAISPIAQLTLTAMSLNDAEDKTGTGNNYTPYSVQLFNAPLNGSVVALNPACPAGAVVVKTDASANTCLSPSTYASLTSGPAGTGPGRFNELRDQDLHARLNIQALRGYITVDAFANTYLYDQSNVQLLPGRSITTSRYRTGGFLLSDDFTGEKNDFGLGWYVQHQVFNGDTSSGVLLFNTPTQAQGQGNFFIRDVFSPSRFAQFYVNAWLKKSSVTGGQTLDPRASLVLRPTPRDVVRFTGGKSVGDPDPSLVSGSLTNANSLNPSCSALKAGGTIAVGTVGATGLQPETSTDYEVAYGHRFGGDSQIQIDYYNSSVKNQLFNSAIVASTLPAGTIPNSVLSSYIGTTDGVNGNIDGLNFGRIPSQCPGFMPTTANLALTQASNAANGLFRGIEIYGRQRLTRSLAIEYGWDVQSAVQFNVPASILNAAPPANYIIINGAQIFGIPLQKQNFAIDYASPGGILARIDATRWGQFNQYDRPPFTVVNGFVGKRFGYLTASLGGTNLTGAANTTFAQSGIGLFIAENQYATKPQFLTSIGEGSNNKLRAYQPTQIVFTLSQLF